MIQPVNLLTHPDFTVDQLVAYSGWHLPSPMHRENLRVALEYFQRVVPRDVLRQPNDAGPWNLRINGVKIKLLNWLQGIDLSITVDPNRRVNFRDLLIAFRDPLASTHGLGNWYTFPSTTADTVAIHSTQTRLHKFKAKTAFTCLHSRASDAHVAWLSHLPAEYRRGGAEQLFVWNAGQLLEAA